MWSNVIFRRNITIGDWAQPTLTYRNTSDLLVLSTSGTTATSAITHGPTLGNGSIFITGYIKSIATVTLPSPSSAFSLYTLSGGGTSGGGTSVSTTPPVVESVYANVTATIRAILSGSAQAGV